MSIWRIPRSSADRWRAIIVVSESCILVLLVAGMVAVLTMSNDFIALDNSAEKAYAADQSRALTPVAYVTLGLSLVLSVAATYRRRFPEGREMFWPAILIAVLGVVLAANGLLSDTMCK
jgi:hypothetical protein